MRKIYARHTTIATISSEQADDFIKKYHRQGLVTFGKSRYDIGLFYQGKLVGAVSFSNPKTREKKRLYQHELVRMTFKSGVRVVGGASKMIQYYINDFKPRNFFTYQTMSGENSEVYLKSGMTLRSTGQDKRILVKNGYTYESALETYRAEGKKLLFLNAQLVNLGPDKILNATLGERFHDDGSRKTNEQLFIEHCDYHAEMIKGDRVYDFNNDNYLHYIYQITNTNPDDNSYYIGRHSIFAPNGSMDDILADGYHGSGGSRYQAWKENTLKQGWQLEKSIVDIQQTWIENVNAEKAIIGSAYKDDKLCLNMMEGGVSAHVASETIQYSEKLCDIHGETLFRNLTCCKCSYRKAINIGLCQVHGETQFRGDHCLKCVSSKAIHIHVCSVHGRTTFNGRQCVKCQIGNSRHDGFCEVHGDTLFMGGKCAKCIANAHLEVRECPIHGETKHRNGACLTCQIQSVAEVTKKRCDIHGMSNHRGDTCLTCVANDRHSINVCEIHGETTFSGDTCVTCTIENSFYDSDCDIHGYTTFKGDACCKCTSRESMRIKTCTIHGEVQHQGDVCLTCKNQSSIRTEWCDVCEKETGFNGDTCMSCTNRNMITTQTCEVHGESKFRGATCMKCVGARRTKKPKKEKVTEYKHCPVCEKEARHVDDACMSCKEQALYRLAKCDIHGETKFRGKKCCKCRADEMKQRRQAKKNKMDT